MFSSNLAKARIEIEWLLTDGTAGPGDGTLAELLEGDPPRLV